MKNGLMISILLTVFNCCNDYASVLTDNVKDTEIIVEKNIPVMETTNDDSTFVKAFNHDMLRHRKNEPTLKEVNDSFFQSRKRNMVLLFRFLLKNNDESSSEALGSAVFNMFKHNKELSVEVIGKAKLVPQEYREKLLYKLSNSICLDLHYEEYTRTQCEEEFDFLFSDPILKSAIADCYKNWTDN